MFNWLECPIKLEKALLKAHVPHLPCEHKAGVVHVTRSLSGDQEKDDAVLTLVMLAGDDDEKAMVELLDHLVRNT